MNILDKRNNHKLLQVGQTKHLLRKAKGRIKNLESDAKQMRQQLINLIGRVEVLENAS